MEKELSWSFYFQDFLKEYTYFYQIYSGIINKDYCVLSEKDLKNFGQLYKRVFDSLINVCKYFLWNNSILVEEEHLIVIYVLHYSLINNGYNFYDLYRGIKNLQKNKFLLPKKYLKKQYTDLFAEFKDFFESRIKKEQEYGMDS